MADAEREQGHLPAAVALDATVQVCPFSSVRSSLHTARQDGGTLEGVRATGRETKVPHGR